MMASSVLNQCACSCTDAFRGPESADAFSDDEGPGGYGGGGQLSPGGKHFFDGHERLAVVESASRVAIHAFFREHKPSKPSAEIDAMIERYERKRVSPRVLLHLVEGAFTRGRIKKRQSVIYQRRSVLAQRLRLEQGPSTGQQKGAKFPTSKAHISAVFHSFWLIFGRAINSRNGLEAWTLFRNARARNTHDEATLNHPFAAQAEHADEVPRPRGDAGHLRRRRAAAAAAAHAHAPGAAAAVARVRDVVAGARGRACRRHHRESEPQGDGAPEPQGAAARGRRAPRRVAEDEEVEAGEGEEEAAAAAAAGPRVRARAGRGLAPRRRGDRRRRRRRDLGVICAARVAPGPRDTRLCEAVLWQSAPSRRSLPE